MSLRSLPDIEKDLISNGWYGLGRSVLYNRLYSITNLYQCHF